VSYYAIDAEGYVADIASLGGWRAFRAWAEGQADPIKQFAAEGRTDDPQALYEALDAVVAEDPAVETTRAGLAEAALIADEVLIMTDGTNAAP